MTQPRVDIQTAKRNLGRALRSHEGFVGVGLADKSIRVYAHSDDAPVVRHFRSRYGSTYHGYEVSIVPSPGFRASRANSTP